MNAIRIGGVVLFASLALPFILFGLGHYQLSFLMGGVGIFLSLGFFAYGLRDDSLKTRLAPQEITRIVAIAAKLNESMDDDDPLTIRIGDQEVLFATREEKLLAYQMLYQILQELGYQ